MVKFSQLRKNQGKNMREKLMLELAFFALYYERKFNEFVKEFIDERSMCSLNTLKKYLNELEDIKWLEKTSSGAYIVSEKNKKKIEQMKMEKEAMKSFDERWISLKQWVQSKKPATVEVSVKYTG